MVVWLRVCIYIYIYVCTSYVSFCHVAKLRSQVVGCQRFLFGRLKSSTANPQPTARSYKPKRF